MRIWGYKVVLVAPMYALNFEITEKKSRLASFLHKEACVRNIHEITIKVKKPIENVE